MSGWHQTAGGKGVENTEAEVNGLLASIVRSSNDGIISKGLDGTINSWNRAAEKLFGYTAEEVLGRSVLMLIPEQRHAEETHILSVIGSGGCVDHFETVRLHKNGTPIDVSVTVSPVLDAHGRVVGASKVVRDIRERLKFQERQKLLASVMEHTAEGMAIADASGRLLQINRAFTDITGYHAQESLGRDFTLFRSGQQGPEAAWRIWQDIQTHGHGQGEIWSRRRTGEPYAVWVNASALKDTSGRPTHYVVMFSDVTTLRQQQEQLEHLAHYDLLTHLPNRALLTDRLNQAVVQCQRHQKNLAVLYLDIDGFKTVNDRWGHAAGDEVLVTLAQRIRSVLRQEDTLSRMGGDEFVVLLVGLTEPTPPYSLIERVLRACSQPVTVDSNTQQLSASIGVCMHDHNVTAPDQLIRLADHCMYRAKQSGKNRYVIYDPDADAKVQQRQRLLGDLLAALDTPGQLGLHYQPKLELASGMIVGFEALLRWLHPVQGLMLPHQFLGLLDQHPAQSRLGAWVLAEALRQLEVWQSQGLRTSVSVNMDAAQLEDDTFEAMLGRILAQHPAVHPDQIEIEVLESSALDNLERVVEVIADCQAHHRVRFALDDFGTGYSTLTYLRKIPAETLKIDISFVRGMLADAGDALIVQGVINLAQAFHRQVVAEGAETPAHLEQLRRMGCQVAQGYAIARPMPGDQVMDWICSV